MIPSKVLFRFCLISIGILGYFGWVYLDNGFMRSSYVKTSSFVFGKLIGTSKRYCYVENKSTIILMHLTNGSDEWTPVEMCAIKSAAVMNPASGVCVLTLHPMKEHPALVGVPNLEIANMNVAEMLEDTPLQKWYDLRMKNYTDMRVVIIHLSDAFRYVYLYKYGGIYLDTDCFTLRNLSLLRNIGGGWHDEGREINGAVLAFDKGHPFTKLALDKFTENFNAGSWHSTGPAYVTKIHKNRWVDNSTYTILPIEAFYAVGFAKHKLPFLPSGLNETKRLLQNSLVVHLWHGMCTYFAKCPEFFSSPPNGSFVQEFIEEVCL